MKKLIFPLIAIALCVTACAWKKNTVISGSAATGFTTNVTYSVNTNNLTLDVVGVQVATSEAVTLVLGATKNDPGVVQALKNAQSALGGILNGANQQTTDQVVQLLKAQNNPALTTQIEKLVLSLSAVEQNLKEKYGASVGGQIAIAITEAVYSGLTVGLNGH